MGFLIMVTHFLKLFFLGLESDSQGRFQNPHVINNLAFLNNREFFIFGTNFQIR